MNDAERGEMSALPEGKALPTRERLLETAERLFAERGVEAVSVRDITQAAKANLNAINYHFGTKEELITEVFTRRLLPLGEARLRALKAVEQAAGGRPPRLEAVLEAVVRPEVEQALDSARGWPAFAKLMARSFLDPNPVVEKAIRTYLEPSFEHMDAVILRSMPGLKRKDVVWRMHLLMGALHQSLLAQNRTHPSGVRFQMNADEYVRQFVAFAAAGFRAALPMAKCGPAPN